jgi:hypothetical protein
VSAPPAAAAPQAASQPPAVTGSGPLASSGRSRGLDMVLVCLHEREHFRSNNIQLSSRAGTS